MHFEMPQLNNNLCSAFLPAISITSTQVLLAQYPSGPEPKDLMQVKELPVSLNAESQEESGTADSLDYVRLPID